MRAEPAARSRLSRRKLVELGGAGLAATAVQAMPRAVEAAGELVYAGFGGSYERAIRAALFDPFAKANDIQLSVTTGASDVAKALAMVKAGRTQWDLVDAQGTTLGQFAEANVLEKLDSSIVNPGGVFEQKLVTPYSVPWYQFSVNRFWNTSAIHQSLDSWADLWNLKNPPGKIGLSNLPWFSLEIALLADGVDMRKLYPLDIDRAFNSLNRIKPRAVFLSTSALANAIASQEVIAGIINLARLKAVQRAGVKLAYSWNQAIVDVQQLVVLKGAPDRLNAMKAVAYSLEPAPQRQILDSLGYTPTVKSVLDAIDPQQAKDLPGTAATAPMTFYLSAAWWGENGAAVGRRWEDWLAD
jgi:putative spermidine/putrescine transport system substrate-binding protein